MNDKNKRKVAKEILYFFFGIFCSLIIWGLIGTKNYLVNSNIEKITIETLTINKQIDSLKKINILDEYRRKQLDRNLSEMNDKGSSDDDLIRMVTDYKKIFGKKEIIEKREQLEKSKILFYKNFDDTRKRLINNNQKIEILTWGIFIIFGLIYPFRFAYYSLMWSIRTLKIKKQEEV
jgi:hypothetical protein